MALGLLRCEEERRTPTLPLEGLHSVDILGGFIGLSVHPSRKDLPVCFFQSPYHFMKFSLVCVHCCLLFHLERKRHEGRM